MLSYEGIPKELLFPELEGREFYVLSEALRSDSYAITFRFSGSTETKTISKELLTEEEKSCGYTTVVHVRFGNAKDGLETFVLVNDENEETKKIYVYRTRQKNIAKVTSEGTKVVNFF